MDFLDRVIKTINRYSLLNQGDGVVVALSGGADSMVLLHSLKALSQRLDLTVSACHLNHGIRGKDAYDDQAFCAQQCENLGIPFYTSNVNVPAIAKNEALNLEEAGRLERRKFYKEAAEHFGAKKVATAHHMNDQAETVIINLIRGSGQKGLGGIYPLYEDWLIRPLLQVKRDDILDYILENNIIFREDASNQDKNIIRNKIRIDLIPYIEKRYNPAFVEVINRTSEIQRDLYDFAQKELDRISPEMIIKDGDAVRINLQMFRRLHPGLQGFVLRRGFEMLSGNTRGLTLGHISQVLASTSVEGKGSITLPGDVAFAVDESYLLLTLAAEDEMPLEYSYEMVIPGEQFISELGTRWKADIIDRSEFDEKYDLKDDSIGAFDASKFDDTITIRNRVEGDSLRPLGMDGTRKLKDIYIDKKLSPAEKNQTPVFTSGGFIFWAPGIVVSDDFKVDVNTENILLFTQIK
ncbi:MAG: tRNA lysidine(34) synthetase TilS [Acidobacteria bacterium]|nr:tRNA lysidine(34) synthetase TilS [Acidobacteriota bacterium]